MSETDRRRETAAEPGILWDALIVGGGPAGAAAAARLACAGRRVLCLERTRFPRFHVGESLLPATTPYLEAIGVAAKVRAAGFPLKRGAFMVSPTAEASGYADFRAAKGIDDPVTFQVPRDRFDQILLDHAACCGATVRQATRATAVELSPGSVGLTVRGADGTETVERGRFLIDASGRDGFLARRLDLRRVDGELRHVGIHAWFEGVVPPPEDRATDVRIVSLAERGWAWLIPVADGVTSVGVVVPKEDLDRLGTTDPAVRLERLLASVPALSMLLERARRTSPVRVDGDYSYAVSAYAGHRAGEPWLLAGDAGSFLDPIFSTGVLLALGSGVQAAQAIERSLATGAIARPFAAYERSQRRDYRLLRRLVLDFYRPEFRDFLVDEGDPLGFRTALVTVLAGNLRPPFGVRLRLALLRLLVRLQKRIALVPRVHGPGPRPESSGARFETGEQTEGLRA